MPYIHNKIDSKSNIQNSKLSKMTDVLEKINRVEHPTERIDNLKVGESFLIPSEQKVSIDGTIVRIRNKNPKKRFSVPKRNENSYTVKRKNDK